MYLKIWITWYGWGTIILPLCYTELRKNFWNFWELLKIIFCWVKNISLFWSKFLSMYSSTFDSILSRSLWILFFISSDKSLDNGVAAIVFSVKNFPKWYLHFPLLYLWQDFECQCTWYAVTNWKGSGSVTSFGTNTFTMESTNLTYSSILFFCKTGASNIHKNEWIRGLPRNWNSARMAWYLTFPKTPSKTTVLKNIFTLYWKWRASTTGFKFR